MEADDIVCNICVHVIYREVQDIDDSCLCKNSCLFQALRNLPLGSW